MPVFEYRALTAAGRLMKGTLEADSPEQGHSLLAGMQLTVQSLQPAPRPRPATTIGRNEFVLFNQQLASLATAGIPLERGLRELAADVHSAGMRKAVAAVADDLEAGASIEQAFAGRQRQFPLLYSHILKAGVQSGRLGEMLTSLNRHLEMANQTRRIIFESLAYPTTVLALGALVLTGVLAFVMPQFEALYADSRIQVPVWTGVLFAAARHLAWIWGALAVAGGLAIGLGALLGRFPAGRRLKEAALLRIPVLGRIYQGGVVSRLADAMALLVGAGCDMPTCLRLAASATGSETAVRQCQVLAERVEKGESFAEPGAVGPMLPGMFLYSMQLGSRRNELQDNLYGLSEMYAAQARLGQAALQSLLLPLMLILVGVFVGVGVAAIFLPVWQMVKSMGGM